MDRSKYIFENKISDKAYRKAVKTKEKYVKNTVTIMIRSFIFPASRHLLWGIYLA